jgi:hypothetical protein
LIVTNENKINENNQSQNLTGEQRANVSKLFNKITSHYKDGSNKSSAESKKNIKDLNLILDAIDELAKERGVELLDREHLELVIDRKNLDKLKSENDDEFKVKLTYKLLK